MLNLLWWRQFPLRLSCGLFNVLKLNTNVKRQPFGGHHYPEYGVTFKGDSLDDLKEQVAKFRLSNNIPAGNPEQDILVFYAKHWPWLVKGDGIDAKEECGNYVDWREWIYLAWKNPGSTITTKEAKDRWTVCEKCPHNKPFDWSISKESRELVRRAFLLRKGIDVPYYLGFCDYHKADLSVFTFLKEAEKLSKKSGNNYPECWLT